MTAPACSLHFTTENFDARPALDLLAEVKTAQLRRETIPTLDRLCIHLARQDPALAGPCFVARGTAEHPGLSHLAHADGADPESAIIAVTKKLGRALAAEARNPK